MATNLWLLLAFSYCFFPLAVAVQEETHEGKVVAVGADSITLMDKRDDDNDKFVVTAETKITRNGKPAKLSDVQVSDRAKVTAVQEGQKLVAKTISANAAE
jgi:hypothetical protein